jgi:biotin carboxylase
MDVPGRRVRALKKVLILAAGQWISTARLSLALAEAGLEVELACDASHPAMTLSRRFRRYAYSALRPVPAIHEAIAASQPDLLIAADEESVLRLEEMWHAAAEASPLRALIERSMGGPDVMHAARSRSGLLQLAAAQGLPIPQMRVIDSDFAMNQAITELGLPLVLKADATSGGRGVKLIANAAEARMAWRVLRGPTSFVRAAKRAASEREWGYLGPWLKKEVRGVIAQKFVAGHERTAMAACLNGRVLASVCFDVMQTWVERGPSSVVRAVDDAVMQRTVESIAGELKLSGFVGFDFMQDEASGERLLIEMNPRPTQTVHLSFGVGSDLVAAYARGLAGVETKDRPSVSTSGLVAVFPHELQRDENSETLRTAYFDVPWGEPALIRRALKTLPALITNDPRWKPAPAETMHFKRTSISRA